jgi:hypothetical protein
MQHVDSLVPRYPKVHKSNYERIFNEGRRRVRAWEKANAL